MTNKKWSREKLIDWCWRFIRTQKRLPLNSDCDGDANAPDLIRILQEFKTMDELIRLSGPSRSANTVISNSFGYLKEAFERYQRENRHYPTSMEIDGCKYFPRVRSLERSWGGVANLRNLFGLEIVDYSGGKSRSDTARRINKLALDVERKMEAQLVGIYSEEFVHVERRWSKENKNRLDFYVYAENGTFGVDVLNPSTIFNLKVEVLLKMKQYRGVPFPLFLVYANPFLDDGEVERCIKNKKTPLSLGVNVISSEIFMKEIIKKFPPRQK